MCPKKQTHGVPNTDSAHNKTHLVPRRKHKHFQKVTHILFTSLPTQSIGVNQNAHSQDICCYTSTKLLVGKYLISDTALIPDCTPTTSVNKIHCHEKDITFITKLASL